MTRKVLGLLFLVVFGCQCGYAQDALENIMSSYSVIGFRYWFDKETEAASSSFSQGKSSIDVSALEEGFHTLHYQVISDKGGVSPIYTSAFYRVASVDKPDYQVQKVHYWFDKENTARTSSYVSGIASFNVAELEEGFHTLHYQVICDNGEVSPIYTSAFYRVASVDKPDYQVQKVRYWFDKENTAQIGSYVSGTTSFNVAELEEGFHTLHYQVVSDKGEVSSIYTSTFYRVASVDKPDYQVQTVRYWFDKENTARTSSYVSGTTSFNVAELEEGFHTLHYQVICDNGEVSPIYTSPFFRIAQENTKDYTVQTVRYWFDNDITTTKTETFAYGIKTLDLSHLSEGEHTLCYQVLTDDAQVSPVRSVSIDRWLYDIYISRYTEYADSTIVENPLFAQKPDLKMHYKANDVTVRGHLTVDGETALSLGKFVQTANWGSKNYGNKYTKAGTEYYHPTTLLNNGFVRADSVQVKQSFYRDRWHFISLPFNVNVADVDVPDGTYWALRQYDGAARAAGQMTDTWINLRKGDQMEAGRGYILQLTKEGQEKTSCLTFKAVGDTKKNNIFTTADVVTPLQEHRSEFAHNRSWNLVGNPYPCFFDTRCMEQQGTIIVWNGNGYSAYSLTDDSYILMPFEAFFIQKPLNAEAVTFSKEGRQHTYEVLPMAAARRSQQENRQILNFVLSDERTEDRSRVVINEQASLGYEADKDAPKFMEARPQAPQLFSVESGVQYAINERPQGDGLIAFSLYTPTDGEYYFSVEGDAKELTLLDTETGAVWVLADGDYVFTATEGQHNARLVISLTGETTAIAQVKAYDDGEVKVIDGQLSFRFMRDKRIKVFGLDGRVLLNEKLSQTSLKVAHGVYILDIDGKITKIMVK